MLNLLWKLVEIPMKVNYCSLEKAKKSTGPENDSVDLRKEMNSYIYVKLRVHPIVVDETVCHSNSLGLHWVPMSKIKISYGIYVQ
jgi:hypothetical protein